MILNTPLVYDLTLGQEQREPTPDDTVMVVPPVITPVVLSSLPHQQNLNVSAPFTSSFLIDAVQARSPSLGQIATLVCTLAPGLWELEMIMANWFDYTMVAATPSFNAIQCTYFGTARRLLMRFADIGSHTDYNRVRILFREDLPLSIENGNTLVAQNNLNRISLNAIRIL